MFLFSSFLELKFFSLNFIVLARVDSTCSIAIYFLSQMKEDIF